MVLPLEARKLALKLILNNSAGQDLKLKLYTNNYTPIGSSVAGDFTIAAGGGYADKTLSGASWTFTDDGVDDGKATYADQTWTFTGTLTGSATVYGWIIVQATSGLILAAEKLSSSFLPATNGDNLTLSPAIRAGDLA